MIFVGGLQYSGKSTFCRKISEYNPRIAYISFDDVFSRISTNGHEFISLLKDVNRDVYTNVKKLGKKCEIDDENIILGVYARLMQEAGKFKEFEKLTQDCALLKTKKMISSFDNSKIPVVDGLFINECTRKVFYGYLRNSLKNNLNLDEMKKILIYFDLGLDVSLERFNIADRPKDQAIIWTEDMVKRAYQNQEIPTPTELPNLELMILKSQKDIDECFEHMKTI